MNKTKKRVSLKTLSQERQALIVYMHLGQFGELEHLPVIDGEPQLDMAVLVQRKVFGRTRARKSISPNFYLKPQHLELLESLDKIGTGTLKQLSFHEGLPRDLAS